MSQKGRKSTAELSVVKNQGLTAVDRPEPPSDLTREEAAEWIRVVNRLPADWFPDETHSCLVQYCRHTVKARHVAQLIARFEETDPLDIGEYDKLLKMQERESRAIIAAARTMRMTQQATYDPKKSKGKVARKPWES